MSVNIFKNIADLLPKSKSLTEFEKRCLIVMRDWIKYSLSKLDDNYEATKATANTLLQQIIEDATVTDKETCIICDSDILYTLILLLVLNMHYIHDNNYYWRNTR
jgi:hypothetical protein